MSEAEKASREGVLSDVLNVLAFEAPKYGVPILLDGDELIIRVPNRWMSLDSYEAGPARLFTYHHSAHKVVLIYHTYTEFRMELVDYRAGRKIRCVLDNVVVREGWLCN